VNLHGKTIKLLLVDDEKHFVEVLKKRLESRNLAVTEVFNGADGIKALRKVDFDVAVLDIKMEGMDGLEVLKIFKIMYPEMAVIILTGHGDEKTVQDAMDLGAVAYISKPCDFDELMANIEKSVGTV
jgi:DNA-binding NtrC family response regulator